MIQPPAFPHRRDQTPLDARLVRARERIERTARHSLAELQSSEEERLSDELRVATDTYMAALLTEIAQELAGSTGWTLDAESVVARLKAADWVHGERLRPALSHARHRLLRERLLAAASAFGTSDPLRDLSSAEEPLRTLAHDLFQCEERSSNADAVPTLPAEAWHEAVWSVAAAIRLERFQQEEPTALDDRRLRAAVTEQLRRQDEDAGCQGAAARLARLPSADTLLATDALPGGHTRLFVALVAERAGLGAAVIEDWLFAAEPLPIAVAIRASGEEASAIGAALVSLADAKGQPVGSIVDLIETLQALSSDEARRLVEDVR